MMPMKIVFWIFEMWCTLMFVLYCCTELKLNNQDKKSSCVWAQSVALDMNKWKMQHSLLLVHARLSVPLAHSWTFSVPPQFLCLKNIRTFLAACSEVLGMKKSELFEAFDLFDVRDFGKVRRRLLSDTEWNGGNSSLHQALAGWPEFVKSSLLPALVFVLKLNEA